MQAMALSVLPSPQWALLSAEKTEPRSLRLHVPMRRADSSTVRQAEKQPADMSSCPITEITTNGLWSSFMRTSCLYTGPNLSARGKPAVDGYSHIPFVLGDFTMNIPLLEWLID